MNQDSREQFEQAYSEDNGGVPVAFLALDRLGDSYSLPKVARAWYWWKRARAGVVVVVENNDILNSLSEVCKAWPSVGGDGDPYGVWMNSAVERAEKAIEAAGVKVAT